MKAKFCFLIALFTCWGMVANYVLAQPPQLLNYQGRLVLNGNAVSGDYSLKFSIYSASTGGAALWSETQTVKVANGVFNALLGSVTPLPQTLFKNAGERYIAVEVGTNAEMTPRFRLTSVAFALKAVHADTAKAALAGNTLNEAYNEGGVGAGRTITTTTNGGAVNIAGSGGLTVEAKVGIGTTAPSAKLHIGGTPGTDGIRFPDGTLQTTAATGGGGVGNTLDQAYDQGGRGAGRTILADAGAVTIAGDSGLVVQGRVGIGTTNTSGPSLLVRSAAASSIGLAEFISTGNYSNVFFGHEGLGKTRWSLHTGPGGGTSKFAIADHTSGSTVSRLVIDTNGKVGIGTLNPWARLQVVSQTHEGGIQWLAEDGIDKGAYATLMSNNARGMVVLGGTGFNEFKLHHTTGGWQCRSTDEDPNTPDENFNINPGIANVGIGTTSPSYKLHVNGSVAGIGPYNDASDLRYKKNVATISGALAKVARLRGVHYEWRREEFADLNFASGEQVGLIAQEVREVLPEAVSQDGQGFYSVAYGRIVPVLVEALKEQQTLVAQQNTELLDLKARLARMEELLKKLEAIGNDAAKAKSN